MFPRTPEEANSLSHARQSLSNAPWKILLAYACAGLVWITATDAAIDSLSLPSWGYTLRSLCFVLFSAAGLWLFSSRLSRSALHLERQASTAEEGYRALFDRYPTPMWLYDRHSLAIIKANQAAIALYGYSERQFSQLTVLDLYAAEEKARLLSPDSQDGVEELELTGLRKHVDHEQRTLDVDVSCHPDLFGQAPCSLLMAQLVSVRLTLERRLAQGLERLELPQQLGTMGYWERDAVGAEAVWSPEIHVVLGLDPSIGMPSEERYLAGVYPSDRRRLKEAQRQAWNNGQMTHEYRILRPDGQTRYLFERIQLIAAPGNRERRLFGTFMDITELKIAERSLARQQQLHERMIDSLPEGVLIIRQGRIHYYNPAAHSIFSPQQKRPLEGVAFAQCIHPEHRAREVDRLDALQRGLTREHPFRQLKLLRLDGSEFEAEVMEILLENQGRRDVQLLVRDVSQTLRMSRDLQQANQQLQHLSQRLIEVQENERRQLACDLHDDIGQQLTGLKLHLQRLARQLGRDSELGTVAESLTLNVDETLAKVRGLSLSLHPLQLENLGLEAAVRWHLGSFLEHTRTSWSLKVEGDLVDLPPNKAVVAFRIVQEAVNNVARHARAAKLQILLKRDAEGLRVEIVDDGRGFDVTSEAAKAQSLGLTSMRERVASLGGELRVSSLPQVGTRITAILPPAKPPSTTSERSDV